MDFHCSMFPMRILFKNTFKLRMFWCLLISNCSCLCFRNLWMLCCVPSNGEKIYLYSNTSNDIFLIAFTVQHLFFDWTFNISYASEVSDGKKNSLVLILTKELFNFVLNMKSHHFHKVNKRNSLMIFQSFQCEKLMWWTVLIRNLCWPSKSILEWELHFSEVLLFLDVRLSKNTHTHTLHQNVCKTCCWIGSKEISQRRKWKSIHSCFHIDTNILDISWIHTKWPRENLFDDLSHKWNTHTHVLNLHHHHFEFKILTWKEHQFQLILQVLFLNLNKKNKLILLSNWLSRV